MVKIGRLDEKRWKDYLDLRLKAIKSDPVAFGSSSREEKNIPEEEWKGRIKNTLFALNGDDLIGMITYSFEANAKSRHIAGIHNFYVIREFRGKGAGSRLMEAAIKLIKKNPRIEKIKLAVDPSQKYIVRLYKKFGFRKAALIKKEIKYRGRYYDDLYMEKYV